jgi:hypothetical protein
MRGREGLLSSPVSLCRRACICAAMCGTRDTADRASADNQCLPKQLIAMYVNRLARCGLHRKRLLTAPPLFRHADLAHSSS